MEQIMGIVGSVNYERPGQGLRDLANAGFGNVLLDYDLYVHIYEYGTKKYKPDVYRGDYALLLDELDKLKDRLMVTTARTPYLNPQSKLKFKDVTAKLTEINIQCVKAAREAGVKNIIVQPLFVGVDAGAEWEVNMKYYMELAAQLEGSDVKILLTNICRSQGGHLVRGICSDPVTAAEWIEKLNAAAGTDRFAFCLDIGVCNLCGQNVQYVINTLASNIKAVVFSENNAVFFSRLMPFTSAQGGQSTMDWMSIFRGLRDVGFDGDYIIDAGDTLSSFSPLMKPQLLTLAYSLMNYLTMQINIENTLKKHKKLALFGAGNMCRNYMKCYGKKYPPLFTCDNNPKTWGTEFEGLTVHNPQDLKGLSDDVCVIICNMYYREIEAQLKQMGIKNVEYFNDEYMPSFYFDRLER